MNKEEIEKRIDFCEKKARDYREVGNIKIVNKYENEKRKWEKLLSDLDLFLIGYYKTHNETAINKQEIEAIEFMLKDNEDLEQQVKKQKEVIEKAKNWIIKYQTEWCQEDEVIRDLKQLLNILNGEQNG